MKFSGDRSAGSFIRLSVSAAVLLLAAVPAFGQISGNVAVTTDYVFRGISQTLEEPAIQGGFDYASDSGFYVGIWGSNVDFGGVAQVEFDGYLGFAKETSNGWGWDIGLLHYDYPGETDLNFEEIYLGLNYKIFGVKYSYADDFAGTGGTGGYLEVALDFGLGNGFGLGLHAGSSTFGDEVGVEDYVDYKVALSKEVATLGLEVAFTDTDADFLGELADGRVVLTISKSM